MAEQSNLNTLSASVTAHFGLLGPDNELYFGISRDVIHRRQTKVFIVDSKQRLLHTANGVERSTTRRYHGFYRKGAQHYAGLDNSGLTQRLRCL